MEDVRIKLAATWIAAMFGYIYGDILGFYVPGHIEKIIAGDMPIGSQITVLVVAKLKLTEDKTSDSPQEVMF